MDLIQLRVVDFRSISDTGWIDIERVTALIGTNESGKTNLLLPLWKLNPARDGEISLLDDIPRAKFGQIHDMKVKPKFVYARFALDDDLIDQLVGLTTADRDEVSEAIVSRDFDGNYAVTFPNETGGKQTPAATLFPMLDDAIESLNRISYKPGPLATARDTTLAKIVEIRQGNTSDSAFGTRTIQDAHDLIDGLAAKISQTNPEQEQLSETKRQLAQILSTSSRPLPGTIKAARDLVVSEMPTFVYYSNYGNLDSAIYLPHVINNLNREDLGSREAAQVRTLRILFDFVGLSPQQILELGHEPGVQYTNVGYPSYQQQQAKNPTQDEIDAAAEKKREREIRLQSASSELTKKFHEWWKQGDYKFRLQADGNHFRFWVSDSKRPEEIELENRSSGLQWFLSFYLIFLVERSDAHENAILLLDEPGLSLHPLAQEDLADFFAGLAVDNQLLFTSHSPFLILPDRLNEVRAVYVDDDGYTAVTPDLRSAAPKSAQERSIYPAHAALGLTVSRTLLAGSQSVVVEGPSDQHYLSLIKTILIRKNIIQPERELVFLPSGGVKGVKSIVSIVSGPEDQLPFVVLDSDLPGTTMAGHLKDSLYANATERVIDLRTILNLVDAEIEDLMPETVMAKTVARLYRGMTSDFEEDDYKTGKPIVPQIEAYAIKNGLVLEKGWKVELAMQVKSRLLKSDSEITQDRIDKWTALFQKLLG